MQLKPLCLKTVEVARKTGEFIRKEYAGFKKDQVRFKTEHDLVSYVDIEAEKQLIAALTEILPEAGLIAEESREGYRQGLNWIIDPLDGTTNFVQGVPHFCVSIALVENNDVLIGVVLEVNSQECFWTWKGASSYCNDEVILVSKTSQMTNAFVATGFSVKNTELLKGNLELVETWIRNTRGVRRLGTAALDLCYVAKGVFDAYHETNLSAWDVAAGILIVKNAEGRVSDFKGGEDFLFGNTILATNKVLHPVFLEKIKEVF